MGLKQPVPEKIGLPRLRQRLQSLDDRLCPYARQVIACHLNEQAVRLRRMPCTACKRLAKLRKSITQCGQQSRSNAVAGVVLIGVGGVVHKRDIALRQPVTQTRSGRLQQRTVERHAAALKPRGHARQAWQACPTAQGQQQGFNLVIRMLAKQHALQPRANSQCAKCRIARLAGRVFRALAGCRCGAHLYNMQGDVMRGAYQRTHPYKLVCCGLKPMVNVNGLDLAWPMFCNSQQ